MDRGLYSESAFSDYVYLPFRSPDPYSPFLELTAEMVGVIAAREGISVSLKPHHVHDAFFMFYRGLDASRALKRPPRSLWHRIIAGTISSGRFAETAKATAGNPHLASAAAALFIVGLFKSVVERLRRQGHGGVRTGDLPGVLDSEGDGVWAALAGIGESGEAVPGPEGLPGEGGFGYSHEGLDILLWARDPEEYRRRLARLRDYRRLLPVVRMMLPRSWAHPVVEHDSGIVDGVTRGGLERIVDAVPDEVAGLRMSRYMRSLVLSEAVHGGLNVARYAMSSRPVVYIDKSGSMDEHISGYKKIAVAAALAYNLWRLYDAKIYFFDTSVHEASSIERELLTAMAHGGTRIEEVLRHIAAKDDERNTYIVITDAIDDVGPESIEPLRSRGINRRVTFIIVPPAWRKPWLYYFRVVEARDVADIVRGAGEAVSRKRL